MQQLTAAEILSLIIWLVVILGFVAWGQTFRRKTYNIMGHRLQFAAISLIIVCIALFSLVTKGLNYGLDFTGGTILELGSYKGVTTSEVNRALDGFKEVDLGDRLVQTGAGRITDSEGKSFQKVLIRVTLAGGKELDNDTITNLLQYLKEQIGDFKQLRVANIGPTISSELKSQALKALILALILQLFYIFFRFGNQMRFGIAADLALIHDVIIMVGLYSLSERQVDSPFIAALLTVVGYSVMDSVVIFDRIRENLQLNPKTDFAEVVNDSVNATMTRSINTTLTTIVTLIAIYYFGGSTLQDFAFALLVGICSGAYSSICVASPLLIVIDNWVKKGRSLPREAVSTSGSALSYADARENSSHKKDENKTTDDTEEAIAAVGSSAGSGKKRRRKRGSRRRK